MLRKNLLLGATIATASIFGIANAYTLELTTGEEIVVASEVDLDAGTLDVDFTFEFSANSISDSGKLLEITLTGATFAAAVVANDALDGCFSVLGVTRSVSTGGAAGTSTVSFLIEDASGCSGATGTLALSLNGIESGTDVSLTSYLRSATVDSDQPVDGGAPEDGPLDLVSFASGYNMVISDGDNGPYVSAIGTGTNKFSSLAAGITVPMGIITPSVTMAVGAVPQPQIDLAQGGVPVDQIDFGAAEAVITGDFSFTAKDEDGAQKVVTSISGTVEIADDMQSATVTYAAGDLVAFDTISFGGISDTPYVPSDYSVVVTYELESDDADFLATSPVTGTFASIGRDGTTLVFPWVSTGTQGADTGSTNLIRIGNLTAVEAGAVNARVMNSTEEDFVISAATTEVAASIDANGEVVLSSQDLEDALGNWGRGDIEIIVEQASDDITANRLVVNGDRIFNMHAGDASFYVNPLAEPPV